jgi:DNA end-binding protein Ku
MKAIWNGSVGFGLVNIPVKLYSATQQSSLDFYMVDKRDFGKIHFQRVNEKTGQEVTWENIAKAYDDHGHYIMLEEEDFEQAAPEKSKVIAIAHFVNEQEIDTIYFENAYYLEPEKSGAKAYALLREALIKSGKVGLAQFVLRTAATLCVIKPLNNILVLNKIRFPEEIRSTDEFNLPEKSAINPAALKMAMALIDQYTAPFEIKKYKDEYSAALLKVIKAKENGQQKWTPKFNITQTYTQDLMAQLKASLEKRKVS